MASFALSLADVRCSTTGMLRFGAAEAVTADIEAYAIEHQRLLDRRLRDTRWISAVAAGDEDAFAEVFHEFYAPMVRAASLRLTTLDDAEEIVQQVFMNLWRMRCSWEPHQSVGAYLLGALRRQIAFQGRTDTRRRHALGRLAETGDATGPLPRSARTDERLMVDELGRGARRAIAGLSDRLRETFLLAKDGAWSTEAIAQHLGITPAAVRMNIKRAYRALRVQLADYV